jgi:hypothetical protein
MTGYRCEFLQGHAGYSGCPRWPISRAPFRVAALHALCLWRLFAAWRKVDSIKKNYTNQIAHFHDFADS